MGVLNVTPDSFSDGGIDTSPAVAVARGIEMWHGGADIVDVGGESTRPGADPVGVAEELERVIPVVSALAAEGIVVSVDTMKPDVAVAAVTSGAQVINDVGGLRDPAMAAIAAESGVGVVIMHMPGDPRTMQEMVVEREILGEVTAYLDQQSQLAMDAGIDRNRICVDPGIGFGKSYTQNLEILDGIADILSLQFPVLVGASRKGFIGAALAASGVETIAAQRDSASTAAAAMAIAGGAAVVRAHDVPATLQVARLTDAIVRGHFEDEGNIGRT